MNLEPKPRWQVERDYWDWSRWWREEKPSERYERLKLKREKKEEKKEEEERREKKKKEWEVDGRRKVFNFLQKQKDRDEVEEMGRKWRAEHREKRRRSTLEREKAALKRMVAECYDGGSARIFL